MRAVAKALKTFVGSFDIPAYALNTIPKDVEMPYLTYPIVEPEWDRKATFYIKGYYRTTDYSDLLEKADAIAEAIGTGKKIDLEHGYLVIYPETPLIQTLVEDENDVRSFYINLSINAYHMPGV